MKTKTFKVKLWTDSNIQFASASTMRGQIGVSCVGNSEQDAVINALSGLADAMSTWEARKKEKLNKKQ